MKSQLGKNIIGEVQLLKNLRNFYTFSKCKSIYDLRETEDYRIYCILTEHVFDPVLEVHIMLDDSRINSLINEGWSLVVPISGEKLRFVKWGTSIPENLENIYLEVAESWNNDSEIEIKGVLCAFKI